MSGRSGLIAKGLAAQFDVLRRPSSYVSARLRAGKDPDCRLWYRIDVGASYRAYTVPRVHTLRAWGSSAL